MIFWTETDEYDDHLPARMNAASPKAAPQHQNAKQDRMMYPT